MSSSPIIRSGFVALWGRPNVGKSTLLNALVGERLAIATPKPQTTRSRLIGVYNHPDGSQVAFVDTPGMHQAHTELNRFMVREALGGLEGVDVVVFVTEAERLQPDRPFKPSAADEVCLGELKRGERQAAKVVLALNKIDRLADKRDLLPLLAAWHEVHPFAAAVPISAKNGDGVAQLAEVVVGLLPAGEPNYPRDQLTDRPERFLVAELVREQVLLLTRQEVPHATAVSIDAWEDRDTSTEPAPAQTTIGRPAKKGGKSRGKPMPDAAPVAVGEGALTGLTVIAATIHVERDSQKAIVVGHGGRMIKAIGQAARRRIESLLGRRVFLELFVRVDPDWRSDPRTLRLLGYE